MKPFIFLFVYICDLANTIQSPGIFLPIYPLPFYTEVSPCSCDLTDKKCDIYCCCDKDCPDEAKQNLICMSGLDGGVDDGKIVDGNCSRQSLYDSDGYPLLCLQNHNSPYIGLYYNEIAHANNLRSHLNVVDRIKKRSSDPTDDGQSASPLPSYENRAKIIQPFPVSKGYRYGTPLRTVYDYANGIYGVVQLPSSLASACVLSPVRFLKNSASVCTTRLTPEKCASGRGTILDYQMYLIHPPDNVLISNVPEVLRIANSRQVAELKVTYYNVLSAESYLKKQKIGVQSFSASNTSSKSDTSETIVKRSRQFFERDSFSRIKSQIESEREILTNIFSQVYYDPDFEICANLVLEVQYRFYWQASAVEKVEVDIYLGNLTLETKANVTEKIVSPSASSFEDLQQFFSATFIHNQATKDENVVHKSGEPGYDPRKPLILASSDNGDFRIEDSGLKHWSHLTSTSLCRESANQKVGFQDEVFSGCYLELERSNFTKCSKLREAVKSIQRSLIAGTWIAKGGNMNESSIDEFIPIIFEEDNFVGIKDRTNDVAQCSVPSEMHVEVMYTRSSQRNTDVFSIYRVTGMKVSWRFNQWSWICRNPKNCGSIQQFPLIMTVEQFEVPIVWHYQNTSRFWVIQDWGFCQGGKCWNELLFPFTHPETGDDISYAIACAAFFIPTIFLLLWFIREEW